MNYNFRQVRTRTVEGVTVKVTLLYDRYEVEILIPKEARKEEMCIRTKDFIFKFKMKDKCYGTTKINLKKKYLLDPRTRTWIDVNAHSRMEFNRKNFSGSITLKPKFYISKSHRKDVEAHKLWLKYLTKVVERYEIDKAKPPKPSEPVYTQYTHTNIAKPFQGGLVSPK